MARVRVHVLCGLPLDDCLCGDDPEPVEPGDDDEDEAA